MSTDHQWELWGARDPYFGVLTNPTFRSAVLTGEAKEEFMASGRWHVDYVLATCRQQLLADFAPRRVLDFGCGVGRLVMPFARHAAEVVGADVSPSMLAEAQRNCQAAGLDNVSLVRSDDSFAALDGDFDLVHSCIVLQHIEVPRGRLLFKQLLDRIRPGGVGALHVTFAWDVYAANFGQPPKPVVPEPKPPAAPAPAAVAPVPPPARSLRRVLVDALGWPSKAASDESAQVVSAVAAMPTTAPQVPAATPQPPPGADPEMQMNYYNLSELLYLIQRRGATRVYSDLTDHGGALGAFLFFRLPG